MGLLGTLLVFREPSILEGSGSSGFSVLGFRGLGFRGLRVLGVGFKG